MPSSKEYMEHIMECCSGSENITYRMMMGEYIIYCKDKVVGGIYDDRLLVKAVKVVSDRIPDAHFESPYKGARDMLRVDDIDSIDILELFNAIYDALSDR